MVYGTYNYRIHGVYKPTNITGPHWGPPTFTAGIPAWCSQAKPGQARNGVLDSTHHVLPQHWQSPGLLPMGQDVLVHIHQQKLDAPIWNMNENLSSLSGPFLRGYLILYQGVWARDSSWFFKMVHYPGDSTSKKYRRKNRAISQQDVGLFKTELKEQTWIWEIYRNIPIACQSGLLSSNKEIRMLVCWKPLLVLLDSTWFHHPEKLTHNIWASCNISDDSSYWPWFQWGHVALFYWPRSYPAMLDMIWANLNDFAKRHVVPVVALEANAHVTHTIAQAIFVGCKQAPGEGRWEVHQFHGVFLYQEKGVEPSMWHNFELFQIVLWIKPVLISQPWFSQPFNQGFPRVFPTKTHGFSMIPWLWAFPSSSQQFPAIPNPPASLRNEPTAVERYQKCWCPTESFVPYSWVFRSDIWTFGYSYRINHLEFEHLIFFMCSYWTFL